MYKNNERESHYGNGEEWKQNHLHHRRHRRRRRLYHHHHDCTSIDISLFSPEVERNVISHIVVSPPLETTAEYRILFLFCVSISPVFTSTSIIMLRHTPVDTNKRTCVCGIATPLRTNNKRWTHPCRDVLSRARSSAYVAVGIAYHQLASSFSWPLGHRHHLGWARRECNTLQETKHYHRYNGKQENGKGKSNPQFNYYWENRIQNALSSRVKARYFVALRKNKLDKKNRRSSIASRFEQSKLRLKLRKPDGWEHWQPQRI